MQNWELHDYRKKQPTPMTLYDWGLCLGFSYLFYTSLTINIKNERWPLFSLLGSRSPLVFLLRSFTFS